MIAFRPVPSRRIGRSIGINNIPCKVCSYSCVYCQVGKTDRMQVERCPFYDPEDLVACVVKQVENARKKGEAIDYLTFVPDGEPTLDSIWKGILDFSKYFRGDFVTETMLIQNRYHDLDDINRLAEFIASLNPDKAYLAIPTRPPLEHWVKPSDPETLNRTFQIFDEKVDHVEYLIGFEGDAFAFTGDAEKDLLSITAVHPMRESAVKSLLSRANEDWTLVEKLLFEKKLVETQDEGQWFYMRQ